MLKRTAMISTVASALIALLALLYTIVKDNDSVGFSFPWMKKNQLSLISIDEVFETLKSDNLTELQKSDFMQKYDGRVVKWSGIVCAVKPYKNGECLVSFCPESQMEESAPDKVIAYLPSTARSALIELDKKDRIEIQGRLDFSTLNQVILRDAQLLNVTKL